MNSGTESIKLVFGENKIRRKKKINDDVAIDIPKKYLSKYSDIDLLSQKIRIVRFNEEKDDEIELTNDYLWASAFSKNAFNNQIGYWLLYLLIIISYVYCVLTSIIEINIFFFIFIILGIFQLISFNGVMQLEGNLRFFIINDFKSTFLRSRDIWSFSIIGYYGILLLTYYKMVPELLTLHNFFYLGIVCLLEYFFIMLGNDFFSSNIGSGMMNDRLSELIRIRNTINDQIYNKKRLIEDPDTYYYDYLIAKKYKLVKWRYLLFGKYVLEPDLSEDDIRTLSRSQVHFQNFQYGLHVRKNRH